MEKEEFRLPVVHLGIIPIKPADPFSLDIATQCFIKKYKKPKSAFKTKLKVLTYSLQLMKGSWFSTEQGNVCLLSKIQRFFIFKEDPRMVMLAIEQNGHREFVQLRTKKVNDSNRLCDHIEKYKTTSGEFSLTTRMTGVGVLGPDQEMQEHGNTLETIRRTIVLPSEAEISAGASAVPNGDLRLNEIEVIEPPARITTHEFIVHEAPRTPEPEEQTRYINCEIVDDHMQPGPSSLSTLQPVQPLPQQLNKTRLVSASFHQETSSKNSHPHRNRHRPSSGTSSGRRSPAPTEESPWEVDVKYISYDPRLGNYIDDNGPVYMFTAHQIVPERRRAYSICTSSSDNSSSSDDSGSDLEPAAELEASVVFGEEVGAAYNGVDGIGGLRRTRLFD